MFNASFDLSPLIATIAAVGLSPAALILALLSAIAAGLLLWRAMTTGAAACASGDCPISSRVVALVKTETQDALTARKAAPTEESGAAHAWRDAA